MRYIQRNIPDTFATLTTSGNATIGNNLNVANVVGTSGVYMPLFASYWVIVDAGGNGITRLRDNGASNGSCIQTPCYSASSIGASQNNYNPGGRSRIQRWTAGGAFNVTGLTFATAGVDGEDHVIINVGANNITLTHEDAASTAANRFNCTTAANIVLSANQMAWAIYDNTTQRWRVTKLN